MPLTVDDRQFLKGLYQKLQDKPLEPGDPLYEPVYAYEGCDDPIDELERRIEYADVESLSLFSGFRGSGKTTELFRLRERLQNSGATVLYADALEYLNPASPVEIADVLIVLAGAFSDALEKEHIVIANEGYWTRLRNWLTKTEVGVKELGLKAGFEDGGADIKLEFRSTPSFRQRLSRHLSSRIGELRDEVWQFFEDGVKAIRARRGADSKVVFLFDSLEQIRGSLSNEQEVTHSVEVLFSTHLKNLEIPYVRDLYCAAVAQIRLARCGYYRVAVYPIVGEQSPPVRMRSRSPCPAILGCKTLRYARARAVFRPKTLGTRRRVYRSLRRALPRPPAFAPRNRTSRERPAGCGRSDPARHRARPQQLSTDFAGRRPMVVRNRARTRHLVED